VPVLSLIEDVWIGSGDTRQVVSTTVAAWPDPKQWICIRDMRTIGEPGRWRISRDRCNTWEQDFETAKEALAFLEAELQRPFPNMAGLPKVAKNWTCAGCDRPLLGIMFVERASPGESRGDFGAICPACTHEHPLVANPGHKIVRVDTVEAREDD
jgi:hypothetical protein